MRTLDEAFQTYVNEVFDNPVEVDVTQIIEMRRAFMAGAKVMFEALREISAKYPEPEAIKHLEVLNEELNIFVKMVALGVA